MGEPGDEELYKTKSRENVQVLDIDEVNDPLNSRRDSNLYRLHVITRLDRLAKVLEGRELAESSESLVNSLVDALNRNTKATVLLVKELQGKQSVEEPTPPQAGPTQSQPEPSPPPEGTVPSSGTAVEEPEPAAVG